MNDFITLGTRFVILFAAIPTNINSLAISVCRGNNFVALVAKHKVVFEATGASERAIARFDNLVAGVIFFAVFAKAIVIVEAVFADVNALAVAVDDFPCFGIILVAFRAVFIFVRVARIAIKPAGNFFAARDAQPISSDLKDFVVIEVVFTDRDFGVEFWMWPVGIAAEAVACVNANIAFVAAIFFGEPEIGHVFKFGNFTLNKVTIKL